MKRNDDAKYREIEKKAEEFKKFLRNGSFKEANNCPLYLQLGFLAKSIINQPFGLPKDQYLEIAAYSIFKIIYCDQGVEKELNEFISFLYLINKKGGFDLNKLVNQIVAIGNSPELYYHLHQKLSNELMKKGML